MLGDRATLRLKTNKKTPGSHEPLPLGSVNFIGRLTELTEILIYRGVMIDTDFRPLVLASNSHNLSHSLLLQCWGCQALRAALCPSLPSFHCNVSPFLVECLKTLPWEGPTLHLVGRNVDIMKLP